MIGTYDRCMIIDDTLTILRRYRWLLTKQKLYNVRDIQIYPFNLEPALCENSTQAIDKTYFNIISHIDYSHL